jgi:hypothetical protein
VASVTESLELVTVLPKSSMMRPVGCGLIVAPEDMPAGWLLIAMPVARPGLTVKLPDEPVAEPPVV